MVFTSFNFLLFFPVVAILFYLSPGRWRWIILLSASFFFYINIKPVYALLLLAVISSTYFFTRIIAKTEKDSQKSFYLVLNIILVLLPLFFFKYFADINNSILQVLENWNMRWPLPEIKFMLPVGISFYTFMAIGYTIDVYNDEIDAEQNFGIVALFLSFFPLILSGPIERAKNMIPQFRTFQPLRHENITVGLKMMLWGYFMKLVVADRIGIYVDAVYSNLQANNGGSLLIASVLYPFQVYADLGGYSLIAIGVARVMGINVIQNFNRPFFATSMAEFWRRWHISLISWLTDYLYTPLSFRFRRYKIWGIVIALMLTFLISGIWHGASITFLVWGLIQGIFLSLEALTNKKRTAFERRYKLTIIPVYIFGCAVITFLIFASSQVFARAESIDNSIIIFQKIFYEQGIPYIDLTTLVYSIFGIFIIMLKDFKEESNLRIFHFFQERRFYRQLMYCILFYLIILIGVFENSGSFIYFKF